MTAMQVKIKVYLDNIMREGATYKAEIPIKVRDRIVRITLSKLAREPKEAWAQIDNEFLKVELVDKKGNGFASCLIYLKNLEKKECKSLLVPS